MRAQQYLMISFFMFCLITVGIYLFMCFFLGDIPSEIISEEARFTFTTVMILITLAAIPLSLRLFKFKRVERDLLNRGEKALKVWGLLRMTSLFLLLDINILLYFLYAEEPTFGWLAVILLLVQPFIIPTKDRCEAEITPEPAEPQQVQAPLEPTEE